jgi:hypothetical protein
MATFIMYTLNTPHPFRSRMLWSRTLFIIRFLYLFHRTDIPYVISLSQYLSDPLFNFIQVTQKMIYIHELWHG